MTPPNLDELAFRFFKLYAQCEYALKAIGYGRAGVKGVAEADWDRFANERAAGLMKDNDHQLVAARTYLLEHPPKRQVWAKGTVTWEAVPNNEQSVQILFGHIRRVRNNLYHGGKFNGNWIDPDRSEELISNSLVVMEALVKVDHDLHTAIQGAA